jgi:hypothetical protein
MLRYVACLLTVIDESADSGSQIDWVGEKRVNPPRPKPSNLSQVHHVLQLNLESGCFCRISKDSLVLVAIDDWIFRIQDIHDRLFGVWTRVAAPGETASRG